MKKLKIVVLLAIFISAGFGSRRCDGASAAAGLTDPHPASLPRFVTSSSGVRVTFVGNAGFLIEIGGKKILIDAIFKGFEGDYLLPQDVQDALVNARPPFDNIDLILVTHNHGDHFVAPMVRQHLKNDPKTRLVSTAQVTGRLAEFGNRVITLAATKGKRAQTDVAGIQIQAIYLSHGFIPAGEEETINYGYLAAVDGVNLFHMGDGHVADIDMIAPLSPGKPIDLAFIEHFYFNGDSLNAKFIKEWVGGRYAFPIHYQYTRPVFDRERVKSFYPAAIMFEKELQRWDMPDK